LLARAEAMLRRIEPRRSSAANDVAVANTIQFGDVTIELKTRTVTRAGVAVELTPREYELLVFLVRADGAIISREHVMDEVWHYVPGLTSRTVDQHVARLRHKLEADPAEPRHILTARKAGYRFAP
jgi:DNA-binding response OmpR family regulator